MKYTFLAIVAAFLLTVTNAFAFNVPTPTGYVTDTTGVMSNSQVQALNAKLTNYKNKSQNQIAVVVVPTLGGEELADVGQQIFNQYKIGQAGLDNGVLLLIAIRDHKMRLQTGKGVEGEITDIQSADIVDGLKPFFRANNFYGGIDVATTKIITLLDNRKGQKADPGKGQQFNKPAEDPNAPSHSCDVSNGAVGADMSGGSLVLLFLISAVVGFLISRRLRKTTPEVILERPIPPAPPPPVYVPQVYVAPVVAPVERVAHVASAVAAENLVLELEQARLDRIRQEERAVNLALQVEMDARAAERRRLRQAQEREQVVPVIVPVNTYETYEVERTVNPVWVEPVSVPVETPTYTAPSYQASNQDDTYVQNDSSDQGDSYQQDDSSQQVDDPGPSDSGSDDTGGFDGGDSGGGGADGSW